jgi:DNA-binding transcriptional LysR family regulator
LRDLYILSVVAEAGSMARAAVALGITQPAVSAAVADLEHAVGVRLLDRRPRGVTATPYGATLLRRGRAAFDELRLAMDEIQQLADPASGDVRVACSESIAAGMLLPVIDRLTDTYPKLTLQVSSANAPTLEFPQLHDRKVEVVLAHLFRPPVNGQLDEHLDATVLFNDRFCLAAARNSRWARRRKIDLAELATERWISTPSETVGGNAVGELFRLKGLTPPRIGITTFSLQLRHALATDGDFITALPESVVRLNRHFADLVILPVALPMPQWPVGVVTARGRTLSPAAQLFVDCAIRATRNVPGS